MKVKINESRFFTNIVLSPENMKEVAALFRMTRTSKREIPDIYLSFSEYADNGEPYCSISFSRVKPEKQVTSITNRKS